MKVLLEGRPGAGKTTIALRMMEMLRASRMPVAGFTTEEVRERGARAGFTLETAGGERAVLAHVRLPGPPRVGRYGVDLAALERLAIPAIDPAQADAVVVLDELGKMELASAAFREAAARLFASPSTVIATVHVHRHPFTDELKARPGIEVIEVTGRTRDGVPAVLARRLGLQPARG